MILMTMNNKKKVDNKTNFHNYKKRRINYNLTNKIKNKQKKKFYHIVKIVKQFQVLKNLLILK